MFILYFCLHFYKLLVIFVIDAVNILILGIIYIFNLVINDYLLNLIFPI